MGRERCSSSQLQPQTQTQTDTSIVVLLLLALLLLALPLPPLWRCVRLSAAVRSTVAVALRCTWKAGTGSLRLIAANVARSSRPVA